MKNNIDGDELKSTVSQTGGVLETQEKADSIPPQLYVEGVKSRAEERIEGFFLNKGVAYAKLCVAELIRNTHETLYIFNEKMDASVADTEEVLKSLKDAVYRGVSVRLLLEATIPEEQEKSQALQFLIDSEQEGEDVSVKVATESFLSELKHFLKCDYHFMVGDSNMVRIETDKNSFKAIVSYNDQLKEYAPQLLQIIKKSFN